MIGFLSNKLFMQTAVILSLGFSALPKATAQTVTAEQVIAGYIVYAQKNYAASVNAAKALDAAIEAFTANPTAKGLQDTKQKWIALKAAYMPTEVLRFYSGPIDDEDKLEHFINSWPVDESGIDYVVTKNNNLVNVVNVVNVGLISARLPVSVQSLKTPADLLKLTELLHRYNGLKSETNIVAGIHPIEFMLWGQDLDAKGPGQRPLSDYVVSASDFDGDKVLKARRKAYLNSLGVVLVQDLMDVQAKWKSSYANSFRSLPKFDALNNIFLGLVKLTGTELANQRMFVAVRKQSQEEEHSCFSDTTHLDFKYDFLGIKNIVLGTSGFTGLLPLIAQSDAKLAQTIKAQVLASEKAIAAIPVPFDQAILKESEIKPGPIMNAVVGLEDLADSLSQAFTILTGAKVPK
jgi:putative iron-regulated protein